MAKSDAFAPLKVKVPVQVGGVTAIEKSCVPAGIGELNSLKVTSALRLTPDAALGLTVKFAVADADIFKSF